MLPEKLGSEKGGNVRPPLVAYLDQQISSLEEYITPFQQKGADLTVDIVEHQQKLKRLAHLRTIRGQLTLGQYGGITQELQNEITRTQDELTQLQGNREKILKGVEGSEESGSTAFKARIHRSQIERGQDLNSISRRHAKLLTLQGLQKLIP